MGFGGGALRGYVLFAHEARSSRRCCPPAVPRMYGASGLERRDALRQERRNAPGTLPPGPWARAQQGRIRPRVHGDAPSPPLPPPPMAGRLFPSKRARL
jgi:hypothetical protein